MARMRPLTNLLQHFKVDAVRFDESTGGLGMKQYEVTGMSCAACSARVEKSSVPSAGSNVLFCQPSYEFYGSRRTGRSYRYCCHS